MTNLAIRKRDGFAMIMLLVTLLLLGILFFWLPTQNNKGGKGYIEHQIEVKKQAESQVKDIQNTLKKRYQGQ